MRKISWSTIIGNETPVFGAGQKATPNKLVLVIDDSITVHKIVETCLRREGFEVISFTDGIEALLWLTSPRGRLPGLIFLDITMPRMDGYEVARYLKASLHMRETVIVMLTQRDGVIDRIKSRLAGAAAHLNKPFQTQQLLRVVASHLGIPQTEDSTPQKIVWQKGIVSTKKEEDKEQKNSPS